MRECGILLPVFCLPSPNGIGDFGKGAYEFIDFLCEAGQTYWQILPIGPTGYGDSPYQAFSTFAGNPYFIDLSFAIREKLLSKKEVAAAEFAGESEKIDYYRQYVQKNALLHKIYDRSEKEHNEAFHAFQRAESGWLRDYSLFMALKDYFGGAEWTKWDEDIRRRDAGAMDHYREKLYFEIEFYEYVQFLFFQQWEALKDYANERGIRIIGDIPIYVAADSADVWARPEMFQFSEEGFPAQVAGCPPDGFTADGQLWGNPVYQWDYHRATGYEWWVRRIEACYRLYDVVRIDHFRGFDEYYSIPFGEKTARHGAWCKGPGYELFRTIREKLGEDKLIIAEDLGYMTESVKKLVEDTGFPGMKVIEFAFDRRDSSSPLLYLPHNYPENSSAYTGTHDNETLVGWLDGCSKQERRDVREYLGLESDDTYELAKALIRAVMVSASRICIVPLQDYLYLGNEARINTPSTKAGNWQWRVKKDYLTKKNAKEIRRFARLYGRLRSEE